jgi:hypothetical protein
MNFINVGKTDKVIRVVFVLICVVLGIITENNWFFLGVLPLFSVITGWCPLYTLCGIRTCPLKKSDPSQF